MIIFSLVVKKFYNQQASTLQHQRGHTGPQHWFVENAIQYVKVRINKLLQMYRFQWIYDHVINVLTMNK